MILGIEPRALHVLGKCSTTGLYITLSFIFLRQGLAKLQLELQVCATIHGNLFLLLVVGHCCLPVCLFVCFGVLRNHFPSQGHADLLLNYLQRVLGLGLKSLTYCKLILI